MIELSLQILNILLPSMILALIGLVWFYRGPEFPISFVTTLTVNLSVPALLFHTLATSTIEMQSLASIAAGALFTQGLFGFVVFCILKIAKKDLRLSVAHVVGNTGNLGLPVCFLAFGQEGLAYAMTFFAVQCLLLFSFGDAIVAGKVDLAKIARSPILHAVWLGVLARTLDVSLPQIANQTLLLLGQLAIPLMLITLGVSLAGMRASELTSTMIWSGIRTLLALSIGIFVAELLGLTGVARGVLILETAMPVAVFNYLLAVKHGRDTSEISGMILITHLAAIIYLPLVLALVL